MDRVLDFKECKKMLGKLNVEINDSDLKKMIAMFDKDKNKTLEFEEFV